jgi:hypothetical protein
MITTAILSIVCLGALFGAFVLWCALRLSSDIDDDQERLQAEVR